MSIPFSQGKLQGEERKSVLQAVQGHARIAARAAIKPVLEAFCEAEVSAKLGREKGESRRINGKPREIDWQCGYCGCTDANQFTRDGHYRRGRATRKSFFWLSRRLCRHETSCFTGVSYPNMRRW